MVVANRQYTDAGLEPSGAAQQMPGHRLGGTDRQLMGMLAERPLDGVGLRAVSRRCRGAVRINVVDLMRRDAGVPQGVLHHPVCAIAVLRWSGNVKRVAAHAITHDLGENRRSPPPRRLQFLQNQDARALADNEPIAVAVERTAGVRRIVVVLG
jgi:hypothetical protein